MSHESMTRTSGKTPRSGSGDGHRSEQGEGGYTSQQGPDGGGLFHRGGSGEPLLCVHGITDTWRTWELVAPALERRHDMLAITLLGHCGGRALSADSVTLRELVDEAERDMDAAGFETAHLVGNSLGGWIALELAARGRARSVVALAPAGGWEADNRRALQTYLTFAATQRFLRSHRDLALRLIARPRLRRALFANLAHGPDPIPAPLAAALLRGSADCPAVMPLLAEARDSGFPELERIDCPVRIVWGGHDRILPYKHLSGRLRRLLPHAEWVMVPDAGHLIQIDHPARAAELILEVTAPAPQPAPDPA